MKKLLGVLGDRGLSLFKPLSPMLSPRGRGEKSQEEGSRFFAGRESRRRT
jgi:hypothetical protein